MARKARAIPVPLRQVSVLGAGSWGTTFAKILADGGNDVTLWARRPELAREINQAKRNSDYLPGINLPPSIRASASLEQAVGSSSLIFVSIPSQSLRSNLAALKPLLGPETVVVSLMKGVEKGTGLRMSQVLEEGLGIDLDRLAVASGPNLALEIAREQPTAAVVSSASLATAEAVAMVATNRYFRSFVNTDVIGTEFGGVLKNLIAVAIGIVDGVGYGENTKASIITRGLAEMTDFAVAYGGHPETMSGLAGLGDLIATSSSPLSRNNTAGRLLGQGYSFADVISRMQQTAEGLASVAPILTLAAARGVDMPIVQQVSQVLAGTLNPRDIAPHLTTDSLEPQGERPNDGRKDRGGAALWRPFKRAFDQLRNSGRGTPGD
ncbi:NAD(P)-dependent glycerol-3-phosphate dehydrogenase [Subtercola sp. PAMC28395]|uniref:NAD(P)H-dependent glycerol-3-phosphate dehydrogenase n=1 Tax=Subtercola sp. PAMC28395 TaxID=2846775 RepID=UPI001C0C2A81|nr:NAD(P)H-dependent glycerol-3-phosphate dehydrogenase [Subtercola sp. PAMC28395]QWT22748.1 NAD(P)-dependent glycerol-3-phosphate dehydrogenase [Subtercola sp. PAMC28395]